MTIAIGRLIDDAKCYEMVRELRWPQGVCCPHCESDHVVKNGHDTSEVCRQRYCCRDCDRCFDDLTNTVFAGHHKPLRIWMLCSYFMGLNLSNKQIAAELDLSTTQAYMMITRLRQGIADHQQPLVLEGEVECDEVYVVAGHKGHPEAVKKRTSGPPPAFEGGAWPRHVGERKAAHLWNDSAGRSSRDADAGECSTENNSTDNGSDDRSRNDRFFS